MNDRIELTGITAIGYHGVLPHERGVGQPFAADVYLELTAGGGDDALNGTVDYSAVVADVIEVLTGEPVNLIETLADRIAGQCLGYDRVAAVEVAVHKPHAPVGAIVGDVVVRIRRSKSGQG